ncbi:ribosomal RNA small subunit methyltransferase A [Candidatus Bathyarchaeota archaeon]|nr:ribosomal RNA small subunit methyltransferase A [Candidatus Bathyarchaeota archaeon]
MSLLETTKSLLRKYRISPKKSLGQNFMIDSSIIQNMVNHASLDVADFVLDIGAGLGFLTRFMAGKCGKILAVESDANLVNILHNELADVPNIEIIHGDLFTKKIPKFNKIVSIPPYYISSQLLLWLFRQKFDSAVLILQREFAERLVASIGSRKYGWLAVVTHYYVESELLEAVPRLMFHPPPEVDSVIVRLKPKRPSPFSLENEAFFKQLTQSLFTHRNRKVRNATAPFIKNVRIASEQKTTGLVHFLDKRVRELAPEDFGALANALSK